MTTTLSPKYTFDTFVVGAANRLAVTAGRTVAENPGGTYNPLFVYSGSGLGKTHLLMAVGQHAKKLTPTLNVEYLTLDEFVEAFHAAIAAGQGDAFRRRLQNVDVLLIDDVQFLTNRKEMQAELLRLTEAMQAAAHQIVLTSDRPPPEIADLDERLISRFSGGLVVDIGTPDYETRVAILRRKADERGARFQPGVLEAVAGIEYGNVRELMGAINRLIAYGAVTEESITAEAVRQVLGIGTGVGAESAAAAARGKTEGTRAGEGGGEAEFAEFLTDVTVTVGRAVEAWRARVAEAVLRWEGQGYRTRRLEALLEQDAPAAVDAAIAAYVADIERLQALEGEVAELDPQAAGQSVFRDPERLAEARELAARVRDGAAPPPGPSAAFSLEAYAVGPSNQIAVNAVREVMAHPGKKYNPLVIVGRLSSQAFIDELIAAIDGNRTEWWRARYRRATALLLDDIQLLAGKERTQEELFNLFNLFLDKDRQLVFTAPGAPGTLTGIEERIVSRLDGGLVVELGDPDRDVRRGMLERHFAERHVGTEGALVDYLADRPVDSVRTLMTMVQRVEAAAAEKAVPLTAGLAREVLEGPAPDREADGGGGKGRRGVRGSGIVVSSAGGIRSREKIVWDWPDPTDRLLEELR